MALDNLPGVKTEVEDGRLRITRPPSQPKVTLLGLTNNPNITAGEPVRIENDEDSVLFDNRYDTDGVTLNAAGVVSSPSDLTLAISEAFNAGAQNVEAVAIPNPTGIQTKLTPGSSAADVYDGLTSLYDLLKHTDLNIIVPVGVYLDTPGLAAGENFGYQLANFCYQNSINHQMCIGVVGVEPPDPLDTNPTGVMTLAQVEAWVAALETYDTSVVGSNGSDITIYDGTTDILGDGIPDNYAFWATTNEQIPTGAPPRFDGQTVTDRRTQPVDIGAYLSVTTEWVRMFNAEAARVYPTLGYYQNNIAAAYAGLVSKLPARIGTTNQVLGGCTPIRQLSPLQAERLINCRYVPMLYRSLGYVIVQDNTSAYHINDYYKSDFTLLTTVRITHDAIAVVRARGQRYIGKPNNAVNRNALMSEIDEGLGILQKNGAIEWFEATLVSPPNMRVLGRAQIDLVVQPAFELLQIRQFVGLSAGT